MKKIIVFLMCATAFTDVGAQSLDSEGLTEILSGMTVALALVPEAIAFALIPGFSPLTGLYAAFILCLITAILGGRPGMISG